MEKKKKKASCKRGDRVKLRRDNLFHILTNGEQKLDMEKYGNSRNFYVKIILSNGKQGYNI